MQPRANTKPSFPLIAAAHTPMREDGQLNLAVVVHQARHFNKCCIEGVFIAGSTGEGQSLAANERIALTERWAEVHEKYGLRLIVSVGHNSQIEAIRLARHAQQAGANGVACQAPSFFRPESIDDLIDFLAPVAEQASDVPFYLYDLPSLTHVYLQSSEFLRIANGRIPNLAGVKYTNPDLLEMQRCVQLNGKSVEVLWGCDEALLVGVALGARGAVGSTYNFAAPLYHRMLRAHESGDAQTARDLQYLVCRIVESMQKFGFAASAKAVMSMIGVDCGPVRSPLRRLEPAEQGSLKKLLEDLNFFDLVRPTEMAKAV